MRNTYKERKNKKMKTVYKRKNGRKKEGCIPLGPCGITLVALVITIIVLLIIVGVTIAMLLGPNGIITRSKEAGLKAQEGQVKENSDLYDLSVQMQLAQNELPEEWGESVSKIVDAVPIPIGFDYKEGSKDNGLVIKDNENQNEFVWIPVERTQGDSFEKVENLKGWYTATSDEVNSEEYKELVKSIYQYQGFYVARYEATFFEGTGTDGDVSGIDNSSFNSLKASSIPATKIEGDLFTKEVGQVWNNITYQGAYWASKNMYANHTSVKSNLLYGTQWDTILYWLQKTDALKNTALDKEQTTEWKITVDSKSWGNYYNCTLPYINPITKQEQTKPINTSKPIPTGASDYTKANNIYDLAGNTFEWTQEKGDIGHFRRGGNYLISGEAYPVSKYLVSYDDSRFSYLSFRRWSIY